MVTAQIELSNVVKERGCYRSNDARNQYNRNGGPIAH
jgi:hypothetical protein